MAESAALAHYLLVGMMGAGKTTTGRRLAERLDWAYVDSDAQVEAMTGRGVAQLFAEEGEAFFRAAETQVLEEALASDRPQVVSVAGGAVLEAPNRELIVRSGTVVWLRARPDTLAARIGDGLGRPLLGDDPPAAIIRLDAVRRPLYESVAAMIVDVDERSPDEVVDVILAARQRRDGGREVDGAAQEAGRA
jgi:shikimate kinase